MSNFRANPNPAIYWFGRNKPRVCGGAGIPFSMSNLEPLSPRSTGKGFICSAPMGVRKIPKNWHCNPKPGQWRWSNARPATQFRPASYYKVILATRIGFEGWRIEAYQVNP